MIKKALLLIALVISFSAKAECTLDLNVSDAHNYLQYANLYTEKCYGKEGYGARLADLRLAIIAASNEYDAYIAGADLIDELKQSLATETGINGDVITQLGSASRELRVAAANIRSGQAYKKLGGLESGEWDMDSDVWNQTVFQPLISNCNLSISEKINQECYVYFKNKIWPQAATIKIVHSDVIASLRMTELEKEILISDMRLKQWDSYFYHTQFQYPWELAFNFAADGGFSASFLDREPAIPNSKWILLHPDVGLSLINDGIDGNEMMPSLTLQWFGIQKWSWKKEKASNAWGMAITSVLTDIAGEDDFGHGVSFLYDKYSLTATRHSGELVITFNLNLGELLNSDNKAARWIRQQAKF